MFFKSNEVDKEMKQKIDIVYNGKNAKEIIENIIKYSDVTLAIAPSKRQNEFILGFNSHKNKDNKIKKSVYNLENESGRLEDYVLIHKEEYEKFLKFKKKNNRKLVESEIKEIKKIYKGGISQRFLAKEYGVSVATINKIINNKY